MTRTILVAGALAILATLPACQPAGGTRADTSPRDASPRDTSPRVNALAEYSTNLDDRIDAVGLRSITLQVGAGKLTVIGEESRREIAIEGEVRTHATTMADARRIAGEIGLRIESTQTENPIVRVTEPLISSAAQGYRYDVELRVPSTILVSILHGSGDITVSGLNAGLTVSNDSGRVEVLGVGGGVEIDTRGASTVVQDVRGRVQIDDGEGDLSVTGVTGDIFVTDANGKLRIQNVTGDVTASDNPRGAVVKNVDGDVTLIRISPASSEVQGVAGRITYPTGSN